MLEVVIAAALLLLTVTSVSAAVTSISRAGSRAEATARADQGLDAVFSHLAALPFCPSSLPAAPGIEGSDARDLVAAVFPRADARLDTPAARYLTAEADGIAAGSFVSRWTEAGVQVTCVARFRTAGGDWLGPEDLDGWDLSTSTELPASVLVVDLTSRVAEVTRSAQVSRGAGSDVVHDPSATVTAAP